MRFTQTPEFEGLIGPLATLSAISEIMAGAVDEIPDSVDVVDPTGRIGLTMRNDGAIENFQIVGGWRETIGPARLGEAITALIESGRAKLLEGMNARIAQDWGGTIDNGWLSGTGAGPERDAAMAEGVEESAAQIIQAARSQGPVIPQQAFERAADVFARMDESMSALAQGAGGTAPPVDGAEVEDVVCEFANGLVSRVIVNPAWAHKTPIVRIRERVVEELHSSDGAPTGVDLCQAESAQVVLDMIQVLHTISAE